MKADLEWFRTFKVVYEVGTMSEAAKELSISQPSVSMHLTALESYTGYPLFERNTRKMSPTIYAKQLYNKIAASLMKLEDVEHNFRLLSSDKERVTIYMGIYPGLFRQLVMPHIAKLGCDIVVTLNNNEELSVLLENGSTDLIITTRDTPNRNICYSPLGQSQFILVAGSGTDLEGFKEIDLKDKRKLKRWLKEQIWYNTAYGMNLDTFWRQNFGAAPDFTGNYIIPDKFSILCCLKHGCGLAVLPKSLCREALAEGSIIALWEGYTEMKNTLYIGQRKTTLLSQKVEEIKKLLIEEFHKTHGADADHSPY